MIKFVKFFFSGLSTYGINMGLTYILISVFMLSKEISYLIAVVTVTIINFLLALKFTFKNSYTHTLFLKYVISVIVFSALNYILVVIIKNHLRTNFYVLIFIVTTMIFFIKFIVYDKYIFKNCNKKIMKCENEYLM